MSEPATSSPGTPTGTPMRPDATPLAPGEDEPGSRLSIAVHLETRDTDPPLDGWLGPQLARIAAEAGVEAGELTVVVVDDARMSEMHGQYKDDPSTTDVLTFDLREDVGDPLEGDVVICLDEAERQAATRGHEPRLEALLYAVHGLMHLLGENDEDEAGYTRMHEREDRLLRAVGLGEVFSRPESDGE